MAGGTPLILAVTSSAVMKALTSILDGLVFSGGGDIAPWLFDQEPILGLGSFDTLRDEWEIELCNQAWKARIPMLGICRGCQLMNVARGGSLLQDIKRSNPAALLHNPQIAYDELFHHIAIEKKAFCSSFSKPRGSWSIVFITKQWTKPRAILESRRAAQMA